MAGKRYYGMDVPRSTGPHPDPSSDETGMRDPGCPTLLKACPFCGGKPERVDIEATFDDITGHFQEENAGGSFIRCTRCDASSAIHFDRKENITSSWNNRVPACEDVISVIREQAEDGGLWFVAETITEDILQRALRRLHAVIEGDSSPSIRGLTEGAPTDTSPVSRKAGAPNHRAEIVRMMREDFDPTPPNWEGRDWDDNAEDVADKIMAILKE